MPDTAHFNALCRPFAENLFDTVRHLSASPAPRTGVTRLGYSDEEEAVIQYLETLGRSLGLETERDAAQNLWMTLAQREPDHSQTRLPSAGDPL